MTLSIIDDNFGDVPGWDTAVARADERFDVAQQLYDLRARHSLTQTELAKRVGTTQSVIARLEDADYQGHSLTMLQRIALAVGERITIQFGAGAERVDAAAHKTGKSPSNRGGRQAAAPSLVPKAGVAKVTRKSDVTRSNAHARKVHGVAGSRILKDGDGPSSP